MQLNNKNILLQPNPKTNLLLNRYFLGTDLSHILGPLDEASRKGMEECIRACNVVNGKNPVGQQLNASDLLSQCPPCEADLSVSLREYYFFYVIAGFVESSIFDVLPLMV